MRRFNTAKLATAVFIGSEAVFFAFLIAGYIYFWVNLHGAEYAHAPLDPTRTFLFSLCLFASSGTVWTAERRLHAGQVHSFRVWLGCTIFLGAVFILGQAWEYIGLISKMVTPERNLFGASFFTLTGFHGFHVLCGLVALSTVLTLTFKRSFGPREIAGVEAVSIYWHFVDAVWVVIFCIVYLAIWI